MYPNKRQWMGKEERGSRKKKEKGESNQNGWKTQTASIRRY